VKLLEPDTHPGSDSNHQLHSGRGWGLSGLWWETMAFMDSHISSCIILTMGCMNRVEEKHPPLTDSHVGGLL
jgi:hypothetical protein